MIEATVLFLKSFIDPHPSSLGNARFLLCEPGNP